jgi:SNF2 family DNA or RNA helicase
MKRFPELERKWNEGKIPVLFAHPQSLGHGLNMQEKAQHVCWHSLTWNLELYEQFIDRVFRQGNPFDHVYVHRIIAEGTIDVVMAGALAIKDYGQKALFDGIRRMAKLRGLA